MCNTLYIGIALCTNGGDCESALARTLAITGLEVDLPFYSLPSFHRRFSCLRFGRNAGCSECSCVPSFDLLPQSKFHSVGLPSLQRCGALRGRLDFSQFQRCSRSPSSTRSASDCLLLAIQYPRQTGQTDRCTCRLFP